MRIKKSDTVLGIVTNREGKILVPSIKDSGFTSIAGVIYTLKNKIPSSAKGPFVYGIYNLDKQEGGDYNNSGKKIH